MDRVIAENWPPKQGLTCNLLEGRLPFMNKLSTTADDILACARSLIATGGYNGFSYADIAVVVGIRKASIHHHFPSKTELVKTLVIGYRAAAEAGFGQLEQGVDGAVNQLRAYINYWKTCIGDA